MTVVWIPDLTANRTTEGFFPRLSETKSCFPVCQRLDKYFFSLTHADMLPMQYNVMSDDLQQIQVSFRDNKANI